MSDGFGCVVNVSVMSGSDLARDGDGVDRQDRVVPIVDAAEENVAATRAGGTPALAGGTPNGAMRISESRCGSLSNAIGFTRPTASSAPR